MMGIGLLLNPVTEELLMRGSLIHQLGLMLHLWLVPIAVGFVLNAVLHFYQGWWAQVSHVLFFSLVLGLLYSPMGLAGAIVEHAIADVFPILTLRYQAWRVRRERTCSCRGYGLTATGADGATEQGVPRRGSVAGVIRTEHERLQIVFSSG